ncbi:hypothetical protein HHK36_007879 [Tetracentron sinense]|uniref:Peptidase A1 domain-containing protein n=1 Tax=Tetracentron sinense TaxID=13715 RepID=A0A834ZP41_TETSI|nr:hypothetical protein HHK36_007879 [Tetracentron sinense]
METFLTLCIWFSFTIFLILSCSTRAVKPGRFEAELINRDSPLSPFYDQSTTIYDRAEFALQRSINRHAYLSAKQRNAFTETIRTEIIPDSAGSGYLAKLSIGTPGVEAYYVMDTGSDLLWTQCQPCIECFRQPGPIYDPFKSSTYDSVTCSSVVCFDIPISRRGCDGFQRCSYANKYGDGSYSIGTLGYESITFGVMDGKVSTITNIAFGCGNRNNLSFSAGEAGILGLSNRGISLLSQMSHIYKPRFSYCFSNISNISATGHLILGDGAVLGGKTTPLKIGFGGFYFLSLEDISLGDKKLGIAPGTFDVQPNGRGGLVIDSGSHYTMLAFPGYVKLRDAMNEKLRFYSVIDGPDPSRSGRKCFYGKVDDDLEGFPSVTFHFKGGADVVVDLWGIFVQVSPNILCLAIIPVNAGDEMSEEMKMTSNEMHKKDIRICGFNLIPGGLKADSGHDGYVACVSTGKECQRRNGRGVLASKWVRSAYVGSGKKCLHQLGLEVSTSVRARSACIGTDEMSEEMKMTSNEMPKKDIRICGFNLIPGGLKADSGHDGYVACVGTGKECLRRNGHRVPASEWARSACVGSGKKCLRRLELQVSASVRERSACVGTGVPASVRARSACVDMGKKCPHLNRQEVPTMTSACWMGCGVVGFCGMDCIDAVARMASRECCLNREHFVDKLSSCSLLIGSSVQDERFR